MEAQAAAATATAAGEDVEMNTEGDAGAKAEVARPDFPALTAREMGGGKDDFRRIRCPPHRLTPLRNSWENIVTPTVEHMKLQIRQEAFVFVVLFLFQTVLRFLCRHLGRRRCYFRVGLGACICCVSAGVGVCVGVAAAAAAVGGGSVLRDCIPP